MRNNTQIKERSDDRRDNIQPHFNALFSWSIFLIEIFEKLARMTRRKSSASLKAKVITVLDMF